MKRINFIQIAVVSVILFFSSIVSFAQVAIPYGTAVIDGVIEDAWDISPSHAIDKPFQSERPTVTAYWKAMYDDDNFYVVVNVMDDNHWPGWESGGNNWDYDKPEVYWDINEILADGVGAGKSYSGHYQLADGFLDGSYDTQITKAPDSYGNFNPGGTYAYSLVGEGYVYEMAVPWANMPDNNMNPTSPESLDNRAIGFDVTIIDQDEGKTTTRGRMMWHNDGAVNENWNNMDGAGTIQLLKPAPQKVSYQSVIRDANGELVKSGNVGIRISILQGSVTGTAVYVETHSVSTNINGLASLEVGNGTPVKGKFSIIDWSNGPYFLKTENDPKGGTNFIITGTSEILSTPYALYSDKAGIAEIAKTATTATSFVNPQWTKSGSNLTYNEGNVGIGTINPTSKLDVNGVVNVNNNKITNVATPIGNSDAVNKAYVDALKSKIYAIGSNEGDTITIADSVDVFTTEEGHWNRYINLPIPKIANNFLLNRTGTTILIRCRSSFSTTINTQNTDLSIPLTLKTGQSAIFEYAKDKWLVVVNPGSGQIVFTENGNVGIGTTNPTKKLDVAGSGRFINSETCNYFDVFGLGDDFNFAALSLGDKTSGKYWQFVHKQEAGELNNLDLDWFDGSTWHPYIGINTDGNVGIGTLNPTNKLEVAGNLRIFNNSTTSNIVNSGFGDDYNFSGLSLNNTTGNSWSIRHKKYSTQLNFIALEYESSGGWHQMLVVDPNGNVGIGTADGTNQPKAKLQVTGGDVYIENIGSGVIIKSPNGNCWRITIDNSGNLIRTAIACP